MKPLDYTKNKDQKKNGMKKIRPKLQKDSFSGTLSHN